MKCYQICALLIIYFSLTFAQQSYAFKPKKWLCVYHRIPVEKLLAADVDMMVIDPDAYSDKQVAQLKSRGAKVIAYLSVGEAEGYRSYYSEVASSSLVISENPEWSENYPVKYWEPLWQKILHSYSRTIIAKGFDGLFFDVVDAWEAFDEDQNKYRGLMEKLLINLVDYARSLNPNLICIIQNSHQLFDNEDLFKRIDGINQEGLYASWMPQEMDENWLREKRESLGRLRRRGKFVTILEYTREPVQMSRIRLKASMNGFVPYFSVKELDRIFRD